MVSAAIDQLDRRIIQALYLDPRAPFSRLADVLGSSEQTIARRYRRLFDAHVIRVVGELDSQRLGRSDWAVRVRCVPGSASSVAAKLAQHPDAAWVQLTSGGTEIFATIRSHRSDQRTPLLLGQLTLARQIVDHQAYCLLHIFVAGVSHPLSTNELSRREIDQLRTPGRARSPTDRPSTSLHETDWPLVRALAEDGRATFRQLAERTHWHESTVRRRVEELVASGVLSFEVDLDSHAVGLHASVLLWMSVAPPRLARVGQALARRPEIPFVAATTGSTNLVAALICEDDHSLYEYLTGEMTALEGLTHIETVPVTQAIKRHATVTLPRPTATPASPSVPRPESNGWVSLKP